MPRGRRRRTCYVFEVNLDRSRAFLRIFDKDRGAGQPTTDEKELLRGWVVFAVSALDAYLGDLIMEIVPKYAPRSSQLSDALKAIAKSDPASVSAWPSPDRRPTGMRSSGRRLMTGSPRSPSTGRRSGRGTGLRGLSNHLGRGDGDLERGGAGPRDG
jgi:hypothetical protein